MGRRSLDLVVGELPLAECVKFWGQAAERVAPKEIIVKFSDLLFASS